VSLTAVSGCKVSFTVSLDGYAPGVAVASSTAAPATQALLQRPLLQVAPMIDVTNRHFRMLMRCISDLPVLWTEMTWDRAILYNTPDQPEFALKKTDLDRSLESIIGFSEEERPLVFQLGGCDPGMLARSARLAEQRGYDEINLNCGCPAATRGRSRNNYGARLMKEPHTVAAACAAMVSAVSIPVTVKCRLGCDEVDSWEGLLEHAQLPLPLPLPRTPTPCPYPYPLPVPLPLTAPLPLLLALPLPLALPLTLTPTPTRWEELLEFIRVVAAAGVPHFITH